MKNFDWTSLPSNGEALEGKNTKEITAQIKEYPPYGPSTRLVLQGIRKRPYLKRIKPA